MYRHRKHYCKMAKGGVGAMRQALAQKASQEDEEKEANNRRMEALERQLEALTKAMAQGGGGGGKDAAPTVTNNIDNSNNITIDNSTKIVYNLPGKEDLSPLTRDAIYEILASDATVNEVMAKCFAMVCCDGRLRKNHVYHVPNLKDPGVVLVRQHDGGWGRDVPSSAFVPTAKSLSDHLVEHQPTYMETADITGPKVNAVRDLGGIRMMPAPLARLFMQQLRLRSHGDLTVEEKKASRRPAGPKPEPIVYVDDYGDLGPEFD